MTATADFLAVARGYLMFSEIEWIVSTTEGLIFVWPFSYDQFPGLLTTGQFYCALDTDNTHAVAVKLYYNTTWQDDGAPSPWGTLLGSVTVPQGGETTGGPTTFTKPTTDGYLKMTMAAQGGTVTCYSMTLILQ